MMEAGPKLDTLVAEEVMGFDLRGWATCVFVEGEWSIHPGSDTEGWSCHADKYPVYKAHDYYDDHEKTFEYLRGRPELLAYAEQREAEERAYDTKHFNCHRYDLAVVPQYSTDLKDAWQVLESLKDRGLFIELSDMRHGCYTDDDGTPFVGWRVEICDIDTEDAHGPVPVCHIFDDDEDSWTASAPTAPLAICLAALKVVKVVPLT